MKKVLFLGLLVVMVSSLLAGCGIKQESKIGYVDVQRVVTEAPKVKEIQDKLNKDMEALEVEGQQLMAKQNSMDPATFNKKMAELQAKQRSLAMGAQSQFQTLIQPIYGQLVNDKDLSVIMSKNGQQGEIVQYGGVDLTEDVIEKLK